MCVIQLSMRVVMLDYSTVEILVSTVEILVLQRFMLKCYYGLTLQTEACVSHPNWSIPQPYFRDESELSVGTFQKRSQKTLRMQHVFT